MKKLRTLTVATLLLLLFVMVNGAAAQDVEEPETQTITGTVIAADEEAGTITVLTEDGDEVVILLEDPDEDGAGDQPVAALLADFFGVPNVSDFAEALATLEVELELEDGTIVTGTVTGIEEIEEAENDVSWEITVEDEEGNTTVVPTDDKELVTDLMKALRMLEVSLEVTSEEGGEVLVAVEPETGTSEWYEEMGSYGLIVKLEGIAAMSLAECEPEEPADDGTPTATPEAGDEEPEEECGVTVAELLEEFAKGGGLGHLFREYGRPEFMGVGHVRQQMDDSPSGNRNGNGGEDEDGDGDATPQAQATENPVQACKNGGWRNFTNPTFRNQGECVSYFANGR